MNELAESALWCLCALAVFAFFLALVCAGFDRLINGNGLNDTINFDFYRSVAFCELTFVAVVVMIVNMPGWASGLSPASVLLLIAADSWVPFYLGIRGYRLWVIVRTVQPYPIIHLLARQR